MAGLRADDEEELGESATEQGESFGRAAWSSVLLSPTRYPFGTYRAETKPYRLARRSRRTRDPPSVPASRIAAAHLVSSVDQPARVAPVVQPLVALHQLDPRFLSLVVTSGVSAIYVIAVARIAT